MEKTYRKKRPPYGFSFLGTDATRKLEEKTAEIRELIQKKGYRGVTPASIDFPETFQSYENYDSFRFRDSQGDDLWLRSDATVQVIKGFANLLEEGDANEESKFYYFSSVFRDIRKSYPSLREVYQLGVENIGVESAQCMDSIILLAHKILSDVFHLEHRVLLGDIRISNFLQEMWPSEPVKEIIITRDVPQLSSLLEQNNVSPDDSRKLARVLLFPSDSGEWFLEIDKLQEKAGFLKEIAKIAEPLEKLYKRLTEEKVPVQWEPLLTRKVNYYSGFIFEGYVEALPHAPLRGGAYDGLVAKYSSRDLPAGGFALDLTSLILL